MGPTALVLVVPVLQPLHRTIWAHERSSHTYENTSIFVPRFTFAPRMTRTSSRNVGKFYQTVKLSAKNLRLFQFVGVVDRYDGYFLKSN